MLAAFVILSLVATALFGLFSGALANGSAAEEWSRATLVAESRLAEAAAAVPLVEKTERGNADDGRIQWETRVRFHEPVDVDPDLARISDTMPTRLFRVEVYVTFPGVAGKERSLALSTVKLAAKELR